MKKKDSKNFPVKKESSITHNFIILLFFIITLSYESIIIILSLFRKGIFKKEILSKKTNLGFDLIIKRK